MTAIIAMPHFQNTFNITTDSSDPRAAGDAKWISLIFSIYTV